jgi:mRNA-processing protein COX24
MPKSITDDAFAAIFDLGTRAPSTKDVISTLSRTADDLDGAMASMTIGSEAEAGANGDPVRKIDFQHADGSESSVYVQLNAMAGQFVPFRPPPAPEAQTEAAAAAQQQQQVATLLGESTETDPHHRVYKALFTIEESTDADGQIRVVAHSPRIVRGDGRPRTFLERMARRQLMFDDAQAAHQAAGPTMQALSVRRQRKLKMKKQKYKKLMKRTRNLRRKLDRL